MKRCGACGRELIGEDVPVVIGAAVLKALVARAGGRVEFTSHELEAAATLWDTNVVGTPERMVVELTAARTLPDGEHVLLVEHLVEPPHEVDS